jgi:hypothetical protein
VDYIELLQKGYIHKINPNIPDKCLYFDFASIDNKNIILYTDGEIINSNSKFEKVLNVVKTLNARYERNFYLYSSIINFKQDKYIIPTPLSLTSWKNTKHNSDGSLIFDLDRIQLNLDNHEKNKSIILSWKSGKNNERNSILNNFEFESTETKIFRYENYYTKTWGYLVDEYLMTKISIVSETMSSNDLTYGFLSEKTLLSIFTKTLPLIFGHNDLIHHLNSLGIYTLNNVFDPQLSYDKMNYSDSRKINRFTRWIKKTYEMSDEDINTLYLKNKKQVDKNYDILVEIFNKI